MTVATTRDLDDLRAGQLKQEEMQAAIAVVLREQSQLLRALLTQLGLVLDKLSPDERDGPTLQELLAAMVAGIADNSQVLRRIDRRMDGTAQGEAGPDRGNGNGAQGAKPAC